MLVCLVTLTTHTMLLAWSSQCTQGDLGADKSTVSLLPQQLQPRQGHQADDDATLKP